MGQGASPSLSKVASFRCGLYQLAVRSRLADASSEFIFTPHLMLYQLHDAAEPYTIRRQLLTSANLSTAAWGRRRSEAEPENDAACDAAGLLEIRSFELGVCVQPNAHALDSLPFTFPPKHCGQSSLPRLGHVTLGARSKRGQFYY